LYLFNQVTWDLLELGLCEEEVISSFDSDSFGELGKLFREDGISEGVLRPLCIFEKLFLSLCEE